LALDPRFYIKTYGCQMNIHDSEKLANLLFHAGARQAESAEVADVLVINTCSIRDKAENQLYSDLGQLRSWKQARPGRVIGVGGCVAQQVGDALMTRFEHLDFVFGTHNVRLVPSMVSAALDGERRVEVGETRSLDRFDLPDRHPAYARGTGRQAFVTVMEGCDMFCSFCIVPTTRGREISRPADGILTEAQQLAGSGVREITLLGQTVNAYGRHDLRRDRTEAAGTVAFAELLARLNEIPGLDRIRYTSPHPLFYDDALIAAHGTLEKLCPHVHLPVQSGSNRVLEAMRRRYTRERYLEVTGALRAEVPDIALTTDLIVGFPGETEADFEDTLDLVRAVGFIDSYSFKYSPRPGTAAETMAGAVEPEEAQRRLVTLQQVQREQTITYHRSRVGAPTEILIEGGSRRGGGQLCGRDPYHRVVNLGRSWGGEHTDAGSSRASRPGDLLTVDIVEATPHSLIGEPRPASPAVHANPALASARSVKPGSRSADEGTRSASGADLAGRVVGALRVIR
jgi:tRNA-2-methylthio-N6-dimethylallyladenosine synthase